jgi:hypothetical protein
MTGYLLFIFMIGQQFCIQALFILFKTCPAPARVGIHDVRYRRTRSREIADLGAPYWPNTSCDLILNLIWHDLSVILLDLLCTPPPVLFMRLYHKVG